jgi:hypothetical protein
MNASRFGRVLNAACVLALVALGLMSWSLFDPRPIPVVLAMSVGQLFGTLSLGAFLAVVVADVRARRSTEKPG